MVKANVPTSPHPLSLPPMQHLFIEESYNNNYLSSPLAYLHPSPLTATLELQGHRCFLICSHLENSILFSRKQALPTTIYSFEACMISNEFGLKSSTFVNNFLFYLTNLYNFQFPFKLDHSYKYLT